MLVLGASFGGIDERAFDVKSWGFCEFLIAHVLGAFLSDFYELFLWLGDGGGEPSGDAFSEFSFCDVANALEVVVADIFGVGSVGVDVNEAGEGVISSSIVDLVILRKVVRVLVYFGDFTLLDFDGSADDFEVRRDDVGVDD